MEAHLRGQHTLGVYAIGSDDTCRFLAADFDGEGWWDDVLAYREAANRVGVTVAIYCWRRLVQLWRCKMCGTPERVCPGNSKVSCARAKRRRCERCYLRIMECCALRPVQEKP